ncbi:methyltransferase domain-containing protein [Candidatus Peregrinibacteria bacterium]|nr:methyltransferase domain-containing protein [Candidatus Peregrinibacteria bacterium]
MGISDDGRYNSKDLEVPLIEIEKYIRHIRADNVLELASGHGANTLFLAKRNPNVHFFAMDLSTRPKKKFSELDNTSFQIGDFHDLTKYDKNSIDLVFIIEALCHASDKGKVLKEVARVIKKGGIFIVLDGYYSSPISDLSPDEQKVCALTSAGMVVGEFMYLENFHSLIESSGFDIIEETDLSEKVLPTMERFGRLARVFFRLGIIAKLLQRISPNMFIRNSISGLLMPLLIKDGIAKYYRHVLIKDRDDPT